MYTSPQTAEAYSAAQQAIADGEQVFVYEVLWDAGNGAYSHWLQESGAIVQAIESTGWHLESLTPANDSHGWRTIMGLFRREQR